MAAADERGRAVSGSPYEQRYGFSRAVRSGRTVHISGTAPVWPDGEVRGDTAEQMRRCCEIVLQALREFGAGAGDVVRTRMYITHAEDADTVGAIHGKVFAEARPAATMVVVAALLDPRWRVEIEADAVLPEAGPASQSDTRADPYYRNDLALVHHLGFGYFADGCAPGILELLEPVRRRDGLVLEVGCGSGRLTRHLVEAGHHVIATDASPAMLAIARRYVPSVTVRVLTLPDDQLPMADAIVSTGHALSYLPDEDAIERALVRIAGALRPGGLLYLDLCDLRWGQVRAAAADLARVEDDWALITRYSVPEPRLFVRDMTTFLRNDDGTWRRAGERHDNVLIDTAQVPGLLAANGVEARLATRIGDYSLPDGLVAVIGMRR